MLIVRPQTVISLDENIRWVFHKQIQKIWIANLSKYKYFLLFCDHNFLWLNLITKLTSRYFRVHWDEIGGTHNKVAVAWKRFPRYWSFMRGIQRSRVDYFHKESVMWSFDVLCDFKPNELMKKQLRYRWFKTHWQPCDVTEMFSDSIYTT